MLHITGDGLGGLVTNKRYRDYHLVLEFKWGERTWHEREKAARDSGLLDPQQRRRRRLRRHLDAVDRSADHRRRRRRFRSRARQR